MPLNPNTREIADQGWEDHKNIIKYLYIDLDKKLQGTDGVIETLVAEHGFSASKSQYETRFKKWGFRKNRDRQQWRDILERAGQATKRKAEDVYDGNELITASQIRKVKSRYDFSHSACK